MHNFEVLCEEKIKEKLIYCNFNGLDVYINPKKNFSKYYAAYGVKFGSIDNNFIFNGEKISLPDGTAHFLEHKMFEEESSDVFHNFASTGADGNAFTDFCLTSYLFSCTSQFYKNLDFLVGFVNRPYFTNDNIKKEVGIINEEIKMYDDNSNWRVFLNLLKAMYHKNPVRNDIAGDRNSIKKITKTKLYDAYNAFYTSENMSLVIVGDVEKEKIVDVLEKYVKKNEKNIVERLVNDEPNSCLKNFIRQKMQINVPVFDIGFKHNVHNNFGNDLLKMEIILNFIIELLFGKSSDFYFEMYSKNLIDDGFSASAEIGRTFSFTVISGSSLNSEIVREKVIFTIKNSIKNGINDDDFSRVKKSLFGLHLKTYDIVEEIGNNLIGSVFKGVNFFNCLKILEEITVKDLLEILEREFNTEDNVLSLIEPLN